MAIAVVQSSSIVTGAALGSSGQIQVTLNGVTAGNTLILLVSYTDSSSNASYPSAPTDGKNTWNGSRNGDSQGVDNHTSCTIYSAYNVAAGNTTVSIVNAPASTNASMTGILVELSGVVTSSALDTTVTNNASGNSTGPVSVTGGTPTNSNDIQFVVYATNTDPSTGLASPAGWTSLGFNAGIFPAYGFAYLLPAGASGNTANYGSFTGGGNWAICTAAYIPATSPPPPSEWESINSTSGVLSGTPAAAQYDTFTIQVTDSKGTVTQGIFGTTSVVQQVTANNYVGTNVINGNGYGTQEMNWLNVFKQASSNFSFPPNHVWQCLKNSSGIGGTSTGEEPYLVVDSDGYATTMIAGNGFSGTQQFNMIIMGAYFNIITTSPLPPGTSSKYPAGNYTFMFQGAGTMSLDGGNISGLATSSPGITLGTDSYGSPQITSTQSAGQTATVTFNLAAGNGGIQLRITAITVGNYLKAFECVETQYLSLYLNGQIVHPLYLQALSDYGNGGISRGRFMGGINCNGQEIALSFTTALSASATSATISLIYNNNSTLGSSLTTPQVWPFASGVYPVMFGTGQKINVTFTYNSSAVSWSTPLSASVAQSDAGGFTSPFGMAWLTWQSWSTRALMSNLSWSGVKGLPWEACLEFCNEANIDCWLSVADILGQIDSTYVQNLAQLAYNGAGANLTNTRMGSFQGLKSTKKLFWEGGNEIWNFGGAYRWGGTFNAFQSVINGLYSANGSNGSYSREENHGVSVAKAAQTISTVYSNQFSSRVIVVLTGQRANAQWGQYGYESNMMNSPNAVSLGLLTQPVYKYVQAIGWAPYYGLGSDNGGIASADAATILSQPNALNELFSLAWSNVGLSGHTYTGTSPSSPNCFGTVNGTTTTYCGWVQKAVLDSQIIVSIIQGQSYPWANYPIHGYEGGPSMNNLSLPTSDSNWVAWGTLMTSALRDSRMALTYYDPLHQLSTNAGYLPGLQALNMTDNQLGFCSATTLASMNISPNSGGWGGYGALELMTQITGIPPLSTVPDYAGLIDYAQATSAPATTWFGATLPTSPTTFTTTSSPPLAANTNRGSYYTPGVGGDASMSLQTALNDAAAASGSKGDVIVLQAGTTYTTTSYFNLPNRSGSGWIYVISSAAPEIGGSGLPAAGTRVGPSNLSSMASIRTSAGNTNGGIISRGSVGPSYYRFVGLDIEATNSNGIPEYGVLLGGGDTTTATLTQHITFDRCYVSGGSQVGITHAMNMDGAYTEVTECYITNVFTYGNADNQAISWLNGIGPYRVHNNYLEAMGEITMPGGSDTFLPSPNMASDITITNNHYYKPYLVGTGSVVSGSTTLTIATVISGKLQITALPVDANDYIPSGTQIVAQLTGTANGVGTYQMSNAATGTTSGSVTITAASSGKNMMEFKVGNRVLFDSNFLENAGAQGQSRSAFTLTSLNQNGSNPWYGLFDFTITNNVFTNAMFGGMNIALQENITNGSFDTQASARILVRNNLFIMTVNDGSSATACILLSANNPANDRIVNFISSVAGASSGTLTASIPNATYAGMMGYSGSGSYSPQQYTYFRDPVTVTGGTSANWASGGGNLPSSPAVTVADFSTGGGGYGYNIIFDHNTFINTAAGGMHEILITGYGAGTVMQLANVVFSNNIWDNSTYGLTGVDSSGSFHLGYSNTVPNNCSNPAFINNVLIGSSDGTLPASNFKPASDSAVKFVSYGSATAAAGYALSSSSPYYQQGLSGAGLTYTSSGIADGSDIGVNVTLLPRS
jgi:hypothetical protein